MSLVGWTHSGTHSNLYVPVVPVNHFGPKIDENNIDCINYPIVKELLPVIHVIHTPGASMKYITPFLHFMPSGHAVCLKPTATHIDQC